MNILSNTAAAFCFATVFLSSGTSASALAIDRMLVVANDESQDLALLDANSHTVESRVSLPFKAWQMVVSKEAGVIVATGWGSKELVLIDPVNRKIQRTIALPLNPEHIQLAPDGLKIAVVDNPASEIAIVDLSYGDEIVRTTSLSAPHNVVFTPDSSRLLVANQDDDRVSVIDVIDGFVLADIPLNDGGPFGGVTDVSILNGGRLAVAASNELPHLAMIDLQTYDVRRIDIAHEPYHGFPAASGQFMLVSDFGGGVNRLDLDGGIERIMEMPLVPTGVHSMMFDSLAVVVAADHDQLGLVDLDNRINLKPIDLPAPVERGVVSSDGSKLYLPVPALDRVIVFDAITRTIADEIVDVGDYPWQMTMTGALNYCY